MNTLDFATRDQFSDVKNLIFAVNYLEALIFRLWKDIKNACKVFASFF
ncbi:hypothetical protein SAMN05878281_1194 [Salegentibacter salegens]|uniref:Uncharacterized protein n=1 Tax=Salegentibacter salegens TaxID=143223 RepID=A0A1M7K0V0_9FLAO|nr:hypothetical protein LY58_02583 [Salegentibacter salegens]SHM58844.1 hypothetical protein SAMN05878281_1194 [Salegentibacter salegens]